MKNKFIWGALIGLVGVGCTTRNIHPELKDDRTVMVRQWTRSTRDTATLKSGERSAEFSNPVLVDQVLIFGNQSVGLIALYPHANQVRWVLPISGGVVSELAVEGGNVYFGGGDGFFYSASVETGRVNWRYEVRNTLVSQPTIKGGRAFVTTSDDTLYAFDANTGQWLWHYRRHNSQVATLHGASSPLVDGDDVIAGLSDGFLVCVSSQDGKLKWERKLHDGRKFTDVDAHPVLESGVIYIPSYDGALYALTRSNGEVLWKLDSGGGKRVTLDGNHLYLPSSDGYVYSVQKDNGKVLWKFELDRGVPTQVVVTDRYVIFGSSSQYLYAVDKNTGTGAFRYGVGNGSGFFGSPAFDAKTDRFYILSGGGQLMAWSVRKPGRVRPHGQTDGYVFSTP